MARLNFEGDKFALVILLGAVLLFALGKIITFGESWTDITYTGMSGSGVVDIFTLIIVAAAIMVAFVLIMKRPTNKRDWVVIGLAVGVLYYVYNHVLPNITVSVVPLQAIVHALGIG